MGASERRGHLKILTAGSTWIALLGCLVGFWLLLLHGPPPAYADHGLLGNPQCSDNVDNNGDGEVDSDGGLLGIFPPDSDCDSPLDDSEGAAPTCALCVDFVTTFDPPGPGGPFTRMHRNVIANVPYALDVNGGKRPAPIGPLGGLLGFELEVLVLGLDAEKPTIRIAKASGAPATLPLRIELVRGSASKTSFGYDALDSTAPQSFLAEIDLSDRDGDPNTGQARVAMTIGGPGSQLAMVNEQFSGDPVAGRAERSIRRLELRGDSQATRVPRAATLDLTSTDLDDDGSDDRQDVVLTHSDRTKLGFQLRSPDGSSTVGSVDELPGVAAVTISEEDLNGDGEGDVKLDYEGNAVVDHAEVTLDDGKGSTTDATLDGIPAGHVGLTIASSESPEVTDVTYDADGRLSEALITTTDATGADEPREITVRIRDLPRTIELFQFARLDDEVEVIYDANEGTGWAQVDATGIDGLPGRADEAHVELRRIPPFLGFEVTSEESSRTRFIPHSGPPPGKCVDVPALCDIPPECFEPDPPSDLDCDFGGQDVIETTKRAQVLAGTLGGQRLGLAEIQLTNGPDDRLAVTAPNGRPQDGLLIRELDDRSVLFARLSELEDLTVVQESFEKEPEGGEVLTPGATPKATDSLHVELDTATDRHALGIDVEKLEDSKLNKTDALLEDLPGGLVLDATSVESDGETVRSELDYSAASAGGPFSLSETTVGEPGGRSLDVDPMPAGLRICTGPSVDGDPVLGDLPTCTNGAFNQSVIRISEGDHDGVPGNDDGYDCVLSGCFNKRVPIAPGTNQGNSVIDASSPTSFSFSEGGTSIDLDPLTRFAIEAHKLDEDRGYIGIDSGGAELAGEIDQGDDTKLSFPDGFVAGRHVVGFSKSSTGGEVGIAGLPIECPAGTLLRLAGQDATQPFCDGEIDDFEEILDGILGIPEALWSKFGGPVASAYWDMFTLPF